MIGHVEDSDDWTLATGFRLYAFGWAEKEQFYEVKSRISSYLGSETEEGGHSLGHRAGDEFDAWERAPASPSIQHLTWEAENPPEVFDEMMGDDLPSQWGDPPSPLGPHVNELQASWLDHPNLPYGAVILEAGFRAECLGEIESPGHSILMHFQALRARIRQLARGELPDQLPSAPGVVDLDLDMPESRFRQLTRSVAELSEFCHGSTNPEEVSEGSQELKEHWGQVRDLSPDIYLNEMSHRRSHFIRASNLHYIYGSFDLAAGMGLHTAYTIRMGEISQIGWDSIPVDPPGIWSGSFMAPATPQSLGLFFLSRKWLEGARKGVSDMQISLQSDSSLLEDYTTSDLKNILTRDLLPMGFSLSRLRIRRETLDRVVSPQIHRLERDVWSSPYEVGIRPYESEFDTGVPSSPEEVSYFRVLGEDTDELLSQAESDIGVLIDEHDTLTKNVGTLASLEMEDNLNTLTRILVGLTVVLSLLALAEFVQLLS